MKRHVTGSLCGQPRFSVTEIIVHGLLDTSLPQLPAQNLARWCSREGIHEVNLAGLFVVGEAVGDEVAEFFV